MGATDKHTVLTPQDHEHFIEHGYVVVRRAVPPETVADMRLRLADWSIATADAHPAPLPG